jgi:hypothetical protein
MTVGDLIKELSRFNSDAVVRFSVADDKSDDELERWFCEDGIEDCFGNGQEDKRASEVTICLVGVSNMSAAATTSTKEDPE